MRAAPKYQISNRVRGGNGFTGYASSARALKLATFLIGQCDNNAITNATNELRVSSFALATLCT